MKYTFSDIEILDEEHVEIEIGPDKNLVVLEMLTISKYYDVFIPRFVEFLQYFKALGESMTLPSHKDNDWKNKDVMSTVKDKVRMVMSHKNARKDFIDMLNSIGCLKMKQAYFEEYAKPTELISIFLYVYKFNIDGVKKKITEIEVEILGTSRDSRTSTDSFLKKGGLKGKLQPRYQRPTK